MKLQHFWTSEIPQNLNSRLSRQRSVQIFWLLYNLTINMNYINKCKLRIRFRYQPAVCLQNLSMSLTHLYQMRKLSNWYLFKSQKIEEGFTLTNKPSIILIALLLQKPITLRILRKGSFLILQMEIWTQTSNLLSSSSKLNQKHTKKTKK